MKKRTALLLLLSPVLLSANPAFVGEHYVSGSFAIPTYQNLNLSYNNQVNHFYRYSVFKDMRGTLKCSNKVFVDGSLTKPSTSVQALGTVIVLNTIVSGNNLSATGGLVTNYLYGDAYIKQVNASGGYNTWHFAEVNGN